MSGLQATQQYDYYYLYVFRQGSLTDTREIVSFTVIICHISIIKEVAQLCRPRAHRTLYVSYCNVSNNVNTIIPLLHLSTKFSIILRSFVFTLRVRKKQSIIKA